MAADYPAGTCPADGPMRPRETEHPFLPSADERQRSQRVAQWWKLRPEAWAACSQRFGTDWSVAAIDRRRRESPESKERAALGLPLAGFSIKDPDNEPYGRLAALVKDLLGSRPPLELPREQREAQAHMILFAERAMSDPDLELYGVRTGGDDRGDLLLAREEVRWGLDDENRKAWAERIEEALQELAGPVPPSTETGLLSCAELARRNGIETERLRKPLERWRKKNFDDPGWQEIADRRPNSPRYLYDPRAVEGVVQRLRPG